jgi:hypothetical protein
LFMPFLLLLWVCVLGILHGCASTRQSMLWSAARSLVMPNEAVDAMPLRPDLRYLRVSVIGRSKVVLMVLGYVDRDERGRPLEIWYSGDGDVLRLQAGRFVGLTGGQGVQWSNVRLSADTPAWSTTTDGERFERTRDEMPGYHWQRSDTLAVHRVAPVPNSLLQGVSSSALQWFEEEQVEEGAATLPPSRYAMMPGAKEPVYGEQCLSQTFCLSWQVWPLTPAVSPASK